MSGEFARIAKMARRLAQAPAPAWLRLGIGDDAAVLDVDGTSLVWTVDEQVEGTHFRLDLLGLSDLGYRATMAAASDVLAMGAAPLAALAAVAAPASATDEDLEALAEGQAEAARALDAPIVGGNLARAERWSVATTVLGRAHRAPWSRAGARPGDRIFVAGSLGRASAGLRHLLNGNILKRDSAAAAAWRRPSLPLEAARMLAQRSDIHAAIDVSDGLAQDLGHVAEASGCGLLVAAERLESFVSNEDDVTLDDVLFGGEAYALACTSDGPLEAEGLVEIGRVLAEPGLWLERAGAREPLAARGWDHFAP